MSTTTYPAEPDYALSDVDIDLKDREAVVGLFPEFTTASQLDQNGNLIKHKTGVYLQRIPVDPVTQLAAFPYDCAEALGYYKLDFLPYRIYDGVETREELEEMVALAQSDEFPWHWFADRRFFDGSDSNYQITQLSRNYKLCQQYPPRSLLDVAALNALIRPQKKHLIGRPWSEITSLVWKRDEGEGYFFKKSHAVAFSMAILVHMQIIADFYQISR